MGFCHKMGFALWIIWDCAAAAGTHEYRPMGTAIIGVRTVFSARDLDPRRRLPAHFRAGFAGLFASLGEMNDYLAGVQSQPNRKKSQRKKARYLPYI